MSIEAVKWALEAQVGGNAKVLLIGLANHAHPDGTEAYPSLDTLARYAHCDRSTARRNVRKLVEAGWISEDGLGPRGQTKYSLNFGVDDPTGSKTPRVATGGGGVAKQARSDGKMPPEPSFEPSNEPSSENEGARAIDQVWSHYQETVPNGKRCKLDHGRRLLIGKALKVRTVEECCRAIDGLAASEYHVGNGYLDIKYALLGGGRNPSMEGTIDRLGTQANGTAARSGTVTVGNTSGREIPDYDEGMIRNGPTP